MTRINLTPPVEPRHSPVRFNAAKHGLYSVSPVIPHFEREEDWREFRDSFFFDLQPRGALQESLVDDIAYRGWLKFRGRRFHRESVNSNLGNVERDMTIARSLRGEDQPEELTQDLKEEMDRWAMARILPPDADLNKLTRFEVRNHRLFLQNVRAFYALRAREDGCDRCRPPSDDGAPTIGPPGRLLPAR